MRKTLVDLKKKVDADGRKRLREIAEKSRADGEAFLAANGAAARRSLPAAPCSSKSS